MVQKRRAPSSVISRAKKLGGHKNEDQYAVLIGAQTLPGTQKSDVSDHHQATHSVKSGKKWQVFLYGHDRISSSQYLNVLAQNLDSFPSDSEKYFTDRDICLEYKEQYLKSHGKEMAKNLSNEYLGKILGSNSYMESKGKLANATSSACAALEDVNFRKNFLREALFNNLEVSYLAIKDLNYFNDSKFRVFSREDVVDVFSQNTFPAVSRAGNVPTDYNVSGQKTLLQYSRQDGKAKNLVELEVRNDSPTHYKQLRFNMYSYDAMSILANSEIFKVSKNLNQKVIFYGKAINTFFD